MILRIRQRFHPRNRRPKLIDSEQQGAPRFDRVTNVSYERRIVAFYDVLGWRDKIGWAGNDPTRIAVLMNLVSSFFYLSGATKTSPVACMTTFSDNVVFSQKIGVDNEFFLLKLGIFQVISARHGFFIRGSVTIGDLVHNNHVVFGPALNRAHELESTVAVYPRIVLDPDVFTEFGIAHEIVAVEDSISFLDPFSRQFVERLWSFAPEAERYFSDLTLGLKVPPELMARLWSETALEKIQENMNVISTEKGRSKLIWLGDRLRKHLQEMRTPEELIHAMIP
jgi:hypothetical protein